MRFKVARNLILAAAFLAAPAVVASNAATTKSSDVAAGYSDSDLTAKVAHEVRMYSRYTIWDNISVRVKNGDVELDGQVSQPYKKSDLGRIAQHIAGVRGVTNELKVLPLSPFDNRLRVQVARAIYRDPVLSRYGIQAVPPIHIIVDNGRVALEGVVNNQMEKNVAGIRASGAGLSFGQVLNNLRVENPSTKN